MKAVARKRRAAALVLKSAAATEYDIAAAIASDDPHITSAGAQPISTAFSLEMGDIPVAKTGFVGKRLRQKPEDAVAWTKDALVKDKGFELVEWDGEYVPALTTGVDAR